MLTNILTYKNIARTMSKRSKKKQIELLKLFEGEYYQEKQVGDHWHVKMWNENTGRWQVATYSKESFRSYKDYSMNRSHMQNL